MKKIIAAALMLCIAACLFVPSARFTEDKDTILLAKTIYALGKNESYETKLALGSVVMNRVDNPWFEDDLGGVLTEQQQFPSGERYDDESLKAAHAVLSGKRTLRSDAVYYRAADASVQWGEDGRVATIGNYSFYNVNGNR